MPSASALDSSRSSTWWPTWSTIASTAAGREFPDPDEEEAELIVTWIVWGLTCLRWTLLYEERDQTEVTYDEASAFMLTPPPRPTITPPASVPVQPDRDPVRRPYSDQPNHSSAPNRSSAPWRRIPWHQISDDRQTHARHRAAPTG